MIYLALNLSVIILLTISLLVFSNFKPNKAFILTLLIMFLLTAIFDSLIIRSNIVAYNYAKTIGLRIGLAPVEDFAYSVGSVLISAILWEKYAKK